MDPDEIPSSFKADNQFDRVMDGLAADPDVTFEIQRDGRPVAVVISPEAHDRLIGARRDLLDG